MLECGFTWLPFLLWRFDKDWKGVWREVPWVKERPSAYVLRSMRFSTAPAALPADPAVLARIPDLMPVADLLMYASDHPHRHGGTVEPLLERARRGRAAGDPVRQRLHALRTVIFEGFEAKDIDTGEATIHTRVAGDGPPLLLLHGYPQTGAMWHAVAPALAEDRTVVVPDLRGYGASSKPQTTEDHEPYSKRAMARDMVAVMAELGFDSFDLAGHDRGARVSYRLALDHPGSVDAGRDPRRHPDVGDVRAHDARPRRSAMWHWFFLPQPYDLPERLLAGDPEGFYFRGREDAFHPEALAEYQAALRDPAVIHTICEDYRAGATFDRELDEADKGHRRITCPLLALWGTTGSVARLDVLSVWREWAVDVRGSAIESGHHIPEDAPEATIAALREFLGG